MPIDLERKIQNPIEPFVWCPNGGDIKYIDSLSLSSNENERAKAMALRLGCFVLEHPKLPITAVVDMDNLVTKIGDPNAISVQEITAQDCLDIPLKMIPKEIGNSVQRIIVGVNKIMEDRQKALIEKEEDEFILFKIATNEDRDLSAEVFFPPPDFKQGKYWLVRFFNPKGEIIRVNKIEMLNPSFHKPQEEDVQHLDAILEASFVTLK